MPPHRFEFRHEDVHGFIGRLDRHHVMHVGCVGEMRPVIHGPLRWYLDDLALIGLHHIRDVVAHEARVITHALVDHEIDRAL